MRFTGQLLGLAFLCLAACAPEAETDTSSAGEPVAQDVAKATTEEAPSPTPEAAKPVLRLEGDGLRLVAADDTERLLAFGDAREAVEAAVSPVLPDKPERLSNEECGAGPVQFTRFGGLSLNFQDGGFVGWYADDKVALATGAGVRIGMSRKDAEGAVSEPFIVEDSTLGTEFMIGGGESGWVGGFLEGDKVSGLYAGTNCFFR